MPKTKKHQPFMEFALEYKKRNRIPNLQEAISLAGEIWKKMSEHEKTKYKYPNQRIVIHESKPTVKLTSQGIPITQIEEENIQATKQECNMKAEIKDLVKNSRKTNCFEDQKYYFIMCNYYCKVESDYLPAEISLCEFTLKDGARCKYHSLIDPQEIPSGYAYDARTHTQETHWLPMPPNPMGERDYSKLYMDILAFIDCKKDCKDQYMKPPLLFTLTEHVPMVSNILNLFHSVTSDFKDNVPELTVYPLQYLFYNLKLTSTDIAEIDQKCWSKWVTDDILERDPYNYRPNIACNFHEQNDRTSYCAMSYVTRWAYMIADCICMDIAITMIPGQHCPIDTDISIIQEMQLLTSKFNANTQNWANSATCTIKTESKPMITHIKEEKPSTSFMCKNEFPSLDRQNQKKAKK